jgi:hypothetical protein
MARLMLSAFMPRLPVDTRASGVAIPTTQYPAIFRDGAGA